MGKLPTKQRDFVTVVQDIRRLVFAIFRHRRGADAVNTKSLGSGFFVSPRIFLTCWHVLQDDPHQEGDNYSLVMTLPDFEPVRYNLTDIREGESLHLYFEHDLALFQLSKSEHEVWAAVSDSAPSEGAEVATAGYPFAEWKIKDGDDVFDEVIFRIGHGTVTASYKATTLMWKNHPPLDDVPIIEIDMPFGPGSSGGPIFDATTGAVIAIVHGFQSKKTCERIEELSLPAAILEDLPPRYVSALYAVFCVGITAERFRPILQEHGIDC